MQTIIVNSNEINRAKFSSRLTDANYRSNSHNGSTSEPSALDLQVYANGDINRKAVEKFIQAGFAKTYKANVTISMPWLLAVQNAKYKAALGIRSAIEPLFVEQYLPAPIEQVLAQHIGVSNIQRNTIAEIGHLYSNGQRFTLPLLLVTAVSLFCSNYQYMVFSGTEQVLKLITKTGVNCSIITDAKKSLLKASQDNWGSYYDTHPKVVYIALSEVIALINNHPQYSKLFDTLKDKIAKTTTQLGSA